VIEKSNIIDFLLEPGIKFATVSGIFTTKPSLIEWVDEHIPEIKVITTKSYTVQSRAGNKGPIIVETDVGCYGNAVGLKNPGMEKGYKDLVTLRKRHKLRSYLNISLSANSVEDFITLVQKFEDISDIIELNFSCPHASDGYGASIGSQKSIVCSYMKKIRKATDVLLFPKLTPNVANIGEIAKGVVKSGADGVVAINTVNPQVYFEPHSLTPLLSNPKGHKGGQSGRWIKHIALEKISEIRQSIGQDIPIIGMGGIETGVDVKNIIKAGANIVGIGSVFARVPMFQRPSFISSLMKDAKSGTNEALTLISHKRLAEYKPYKIKNITEIGDDLRIFELYGKLDYKASQFVFIFTPEYSREGPFSIAKNDPLTFIIRKRKHDPYRYQGLLTHALFQLKKGDDLIVRAVYGGDAPDSKKKNAYIIAGGTGIAVVPKLAEKLYQQSKKVTVYYGITNKQQIVFQDEIEKYAKYIPVIDNGIVGRVLYVIKENIKDAENVCFYNIGPEMMMKKAMKIQKELGADAKEIFASIETNNMCGIGICGECECGGKLTCEEGTFFSLDYLNSNNIDITSLEK